MNRRAEHLTAAAAAAAAAVVTVAVAAAVTAGPDDKSPDASRTPVAAVQGASAPASAPQTPGASNRPLPRHAASPQSTPPALPSAPAQTSRAGDAGAPASPSTRQGSTREVRSYVRVTEVRLSGAANGDYEHATETARFTLSPRFSMDATGVRTSVRDGRTTTVTQKAIIKGRTVAGFDGARWSRTTLTDTQLAGLRTGSDPRAFTRLIRSVPGVTRSAPDRSGSVRYTAGVSLGELLVLLPPASSATVRQALGTVPAGVGVTVDLQADADDRPTWIGLRAAVPGVRYSGSMTFRDYR
ncbi:hypothetical protein Arub01_42090 [Actinomadura rubrobrunea]|uniref:Lipoprotein n=1 Tax=Actinomadura rubrobrunea TaxID=115335 RepID=A0A9W6PX03_9ACTN|nr:hypothetical protein Arub01_42090 [Actinomadura rubrobrunea]